MTSIPAIDKIDHYFGDNHSLKSILEAVLYSFLVSLVAWFFLVEPSRSMNKFSIIWTTLLWTIAMPLFVIFTNRFKKTGWFHPVFMDIKLGTMAIVVFFTHLVIFTRLFGSKRNFLGNDWNLTYIIFFLLGINIIEAIITQLFFLRKDDWFVLDIVNSLFGIYILFQVAKTLRQRKEPMRVVFFNEQKNLKNIYGQGIVQIDTGFSAMFIALYTLWNIIFVLRTMRNYRSIIVIISSLILPILLWVRNHDYIQTRAMCLLCTIGMLSFLQHDETFLSIPDEMS